MAKCYWMALHWEVAWVKSTAICIRLCVCDRPPNLSKCVFIPLIWPVRCLLSKWPIYLHREEFSSTEQPLEAAIFHPNEMYWVECFTLCHHCLVWVTLAAALFVFCSQSLIPAQAEGEWNIPWQRAKPKKKGEKKNKKMGIAMRFSLQIRGRQTDSAKASHQDSDGVKCSGAEIRSYVIQRWLPVGHRLHTTYLTLLFLHGMPRNSLHKEKTSCLHVSGRITVWTVYATTLCYPLQ